jgi:acyl-CoA hydrolase
MKNIWRIKMKFLTRKLVTPADLNPRGTLHGGQLLKWIDEEGGIHACLELQTGLIVTKYISEIEFKFPVLEGDVVEIGMQTLEIGKSSCTLACDVRSIQGNRVVCSIDKMVYVRVNKYGLPKAHGGMDE